MQVCIILIFQIQKNNMAGINYSDIENKVAEIGNIGGIGTIVYVAPRSHFETLATKPLESANNRSLSSMNKLSVGTDKLFSGKKLILIYSTPEKGSLVAERQGEIDGISHKIVLSLFNPGLTDEGLSLMMFPNQSWIFYVQTGNKMFRVGNEAFPAKMSSEGSITTGDKTASLKGIAMSFFSYEVGFAGEVEDIDAVLAMYATEAE